MTSSLETEDTSSLTENGPTVSDQLKVLSQQYEKISSRILTCLEQRSSNAESTLLFHEIIELVVGDANILDNLADDVEKIKVEKEQLKWEKKQLREENKWLKSELEDIKKKYEKSEENVAQLEEAKKHQCFMDSLKQYEADDSNLFTENGDKKESDIVDYKARESFNQNSNLGYEIPAYLRTLQNKVIDHFKEGRYDTAEDLCEEMLAKMTILKGSDHPDIATIMNILALTLRNQRKYEDATRVLTNSLEIRKKALGENHPSVAVSLNNLSVILGKRGMYEEAENLSKSALDIKQKVLESNHPDITKQLNNVALICQNQGKDREAEVYYERARAIYHGQPDRERITGSLDSVYSKHPISYKGSQIRQRSQSTVISSIEEEHIKKQNAWQSTQSIANDSIEEYEEYNKKQNVQRFSQPNINHSIQKNKEYVRKSNAWHEAVKKTNNIGNGVAYTNRGNRSVRIQPASSNKTQNSFKQVIDRIIKRKK